jgi:hypothetical protein
VASEVGEEKRGRGFQGKEELRFGLWWSFDVILYVNHTRYLRRSFPQFFRPFPCLLDPFYYWIVPIQRLTQSPNRPLNKLYHSPLLLLFYPAQLMKIQNKSKDLSHNIQTYRFLS